MPIIQTQITGGIQPSGTKQITINGIHDVSDYANADVQVPTTAPAYYIEKAVDANGKLIGSSAIMNFTGVTDIGAYGIANAYYNNTLISGIIDMSDLTTLSGNYACQNAFYSCTNLTSVDLSSLTTANVYFGCASMFYGCTGLTTIDLSSLTTASGSNTFQYMFERCTSLTNINLSSLTTVSGYQCFSNIFNQCTALTSADLSSLTTVSSQHGCVSFFNYCTNLSSIDLSSLTTISGSSGCATMFANSKLTNVTLPSLSVVTGSTACGTMFVSSPLLTTLSFPALKLLGSNTDQFNNILRSVTGCTVHFPSNLQSIISSWSDVIAGFGGTNTTILYDLPATNTLTGVDTITYTRNPKYDTGTALAWKVGAYGTTNFTPTYYTSGLIDPQVGDTIYSDSACTIAVTTIDTIA